ncbi:MAG TPA: hypothetical protein VFE58_07250 [Tepidisphaeraceae bacterium]|nr:hypothetical protein [Tepidisphaeraceae bacterium]
MPLSHRIVFVAAATLSMALVGCSDKPHSYGQDRPPVDQLDSRDTGLQSKEVVDASDLLVQKILALPEFNGPTRRPLVVTNLENHTTNPIFNYDIFLQRLKTNLGEHGRDRIFLLDNKAHINQVRSSEIETAPGAPRDQFGQTDGRPGAAPPSQSVQPEWELSGVVSELPNRGTDYYHFEFNLNNVITRETIPLSYEVRVGR